MARPNQDLVAKDDVPWYLKYGGRVLGIVAAFCEYKFNIFLVVLHGIDFPPREFIYGARRTRRAHDR